MWTYFTDTDCDITPEVAKKYGFKLISMPYNVKGEEFKSYIDDNFDCKTFYNTLRTGVVPTTSALSENEYYNIFEPEFAAGNDVFYIHFSRAMTVSFDNMDKAIARLKEKYPERRFEEVDTMGITLGSYKLVQDMGDLLLQGKTVDEVKEWAKVHVDKTAFYFYADDLKFFGKSGRVSGFAAFMGGLIGLKPIIFIDSDGKMKTKTKCQGRKKALETLLGYVEELQDNIKEHRVIIAHTDAEPIALMFKDMLLKKFGEDLKIEISVVNPVAGSHCGPNAIGVTFEAIHR